MPKRTLGLETIRYKPGKNRKQIVGDLTKVDGFDLLHIFRSFCQDLDPNRLVDFAKGRYLRVTGVEVHGRSVMVTAESGYFGDPGKTIDVHTHKVAHERTSDQSATVTSRLVLTVPPGATTGVFAVERQGLQGAGPKIVESFRLALLESFPAHSFTTETVLESAAWTEGAHLLSVTAVAYSVPVDLSNGLGAVPVSTGRLEQTLEPQRGVDFLPAGLLKALRDRKIKASDFMGFSAGTDIDDTFVTVSREGRKKTFNLDQEKVPAIRVLLNGDGEPALTDVDFLRFCQSETRDYYQEMGLTWSQAWQDGQWKKNAMEEKMPPPPPAPGAP